ALVRGQAALDRGRSRGRRFAEEREVENFLPAGRRPSPPRTRPRPRAQNHPASLRAALMEPPRGSSRMTRARKEQIVMAYVLVTRGRLPTNLNTLLDAMRKMIGDVTESEVREAIAWALRQPKRPRVAQVKQVIQVSARRPQFPA